MDKEHTLSDTEIYQALYGFYCPNSDGNIVEEHAKTLRNLPKNEKTIKALVKFIMKENEDLHVQRNASIVLIKYLEEANELFLPMMNTFGETMKLSSKKNFINKNFILFLGVISDIVHEPSSVFLINVMIKSLDSNESDSNKETSLSLDMGIILLRALLENMTASLLPHIHYLLNGIKIALEKSKDALKDNKNERAIGLSYQTLACITILTQHIPLGSPMLRSLRDSIEIMLELLKFLAQYGAEEHFIEVSELLNILLKNKKFAGKNWINVLETCESIYQNDANHDYARIRTMVIYGNFIGQRQSYFAAPKSFDSMLQTIINTICQEPKLKEEKSNIDLPTPTSVAADLLQFISEKFPREKFISSFVDGGTMSSTIFVRFPLMDEWKFRGLLITLGRLTKTCGQYLNTNCSNDLILIFRNGFTHNSRNVRQAAIYAIEKFIVHFMKDSSSWTKLVFSSYLMTVTKFMSELKSGCAQDPLHAERLFKVLGTFCDILQDELQLYLPTLMNIYFDVLDNIVVNRILILTIKLLTKVLQNNGVEFLKYFDVLIKKFVPYLTCWDINDFDEIRPRIIELLRKMLLCCRKNQIEIDIKNVIELVINMLKIQHARTEFYGPELRSLLKYSPLRCTIFYFFREIPKLLKSGSDACDDDHANDDDHDGDDDGDDDDSVDDADHDDDDHDHDHDDDGSLDRYVAIIFGTLLGTITAVRYIDRHEWSECIIYNRRPELQLTVDNDLYADRSNMNFKISDNNELETARYRMVEESYTLHNEVNEALIVLQDFICPCWIHNYAEEIFTRFGPIFPYACPEIRKQMLHLLNLMMHSFLKDFPFAHSSFLDLCIVEIVDLINVEIDFTIIGECVGSFLYYVAIKEKYIKPRIDVHIYMLGMMKDIFQIVIKLPQNDDNRVEKEFLLSQMLTYMRELADMCPPTRFCNYFQLYLMIFEAKIYMPIHRSPNSDKLRSQAYQQLIMGFRLVKQFKMDCFFKIARLFMEGLTDPLISTRECAAAGLSLIIVHCCTEDVALHKWILKVLWRRSKRERSDVVLEGIWYNIVTIIKTNIWRMPLERISLRTVRLLPVRDEFEYNKTVLTFFEAICTQRPEYSLRVVKDIYKYLLEILKKNSDTDIDPLYRRALTLASSLYTTHIDKLRKISMDPYTMQAILTSCTHRVFQRAKLK